MVSRTNESQTSFWRSRWLSLILVVVDTAAFALCWLGAYEVRRALNPLMGPINALDPYLTVLPVIVLVGVANCAAFGLYMHRRRLSSLNQPRTLIRAGYHWLLYIVVVAYFFKELDLGRSIILLSAFLGFAYLFASRTVFRGLKSRAIRRGRGTVRCLIVGQGKLALEVRQFLRTHPEIGYTLAGIVTHGDFKPEQADFPEGVRILGESREINDIIRRERVEEVFLAIAHLEPGDQLRLLNLAERPGISVHVVSDLFDVISEKEKTEEIGAFPVVTLRDGKLPLHQALMKGLLDYTAALAGTVLWLLFFHWWIALRIKRDSPGPVFFKQKRVGRDGREFEMFKYRTMVVDAPAYAVAPTAEDDPRVTRFGRWLRKTSLDELPQLLNVLRGEMSFVGPRPEMPFIVEGYEPWERRRLDVKPGITGLWQVIGRKNLPLRLNMQYDLYYIKNQSFLLDVEILLKTIPAVLKGKGAF